MSNRPTITEIEALAAMDGIELEPGEAAELQPVIAALSNIGDITKRHAALLSNSRDRLVRDPGWVPSPEENPYNSFIRRCEVTAGTRGVLSGLTVGIKDNIAVAGIPTTNGSRLRSYTPDEDAVVVERVLAAGGTIAGKLNMDDWGGAGLGETSAFGPPRNPLNPAHSAGGSSGGAGSAVRAGEVDLALAVDQGGSGRIPAAFCGVCAMKATHGLVPSRGILHIDHTIDAITPVARTVDGVARLLEVIAGEEDGDPQWVRGEIATASYREAAGVGVRGLRIGIVEQSAEPSICDPAVLDGLDRAAEYFGVRGARVSSVSVPLWRDGLAIFVPYVGHLVAEMFRSEGQGWGHLGRFDISAMREFARSRRDESVKLAKQVKCWVIADRFVHERESGVPYGELHNLRLALRREIRDALAEHDLLLTPTLPITAPRLAGPSAVFSEISVRTVDRLPYNTSPLNLSGNPAFSIPSGADSEGLPTAVQIIGSHFDEFTVFRAAFTLEQCEETDTA